MLDKQKAIEKFREYLISHGYTCEDKELLLENYVAKTDVDDEERTVTAIISTDAIDRDREVILPKGVNLDEYEKNKIVLWSHQYDELPIAKALWVKKGRKGITAKIKFATTAKAEEIYQLFKGKFLKAFSIGFMVNNSHPPTPAEIKKTPEWAEVHRIIDDSELLEFSSVNVGSNRGALAIAVKSLNLSEITQKELGIEDEETDEDTSSNNAEVEVNVKEEKKETVIVIPHRVLKPHRKVRPTRIVIDPKTVNSQVINMLRGRIY